MSSLGFTQLLKAQSTFNYATWNAATKGAFITLSPDLLTTTCLNTFNSTITCNVGKSSGKWYWEHFITSCGATGVEMYGVSNALSSLNNTIRMNANLSIAYLKGNNTTGWAYLHRFLPAAGYTTVAPNIGTPYYATGDVISCTLDMDSMVFTAYKNGTIAGTGCPIGLAGTWYPVLGSDSQGSITISNFGQTSWDVRTAALRTTLESSGFTIGLYN